MGLAIKQRKIVFDHSDVILCGDDMIVAPAEVRHCDGMNMYSNYVFVMILLLLKIEVDEEVEAESPFIKVIICKAARRRSE